MSDRVHMGPDGNWTYGPDGYVLTGYRWVTADEITAIVQAYNNGVPGAQPLYYPEGGFIVPTGQTPTATNVTGWQYSQMNPDKINAWVAQQHRNGYSPLAMTPEELDRAGGILQELEDSLVYDAQLGGYQAAMAWLASADQSANALISGWIAEENNNQPGSPAAAAAAAGIDTSDDSSGDTGIDYNYGDTTDSGDQGSNTATDNVPASGDSGDSGGGAAPADTGDDTGASDSGDGSPPADASDDAGAADSGAAQNLDNGAAAGQTAGMDEEGWIDNGDGTFTDSWSGDTVDSSGNYVDNGVDTNYGDGSNGSDNGTDASSQDSSQADDSSQQQDTGSIDLPAGISDNGDGTYIDDATGTVFDASGNILSTPGTADSQTDPTAGYQDLGNGNFYDPSDGSVYLADTGTWVYPDDGSDFTDPISGTTFGTDGSMTFADGSMVTADGTWVFADGGVLQTDASGITTYKDADGSVWENMDWAGAPNSWQNRDTGDVWNGADGTLVTATNVPVNYGTPSTAKPPAISKIGGSSGGGGSGASVGGSKGGSSSPAAASTGPSLADLQKILGTLVTAQQAVTTARSGGATIPQLGTLQSNLVKAAQQAAAAKTGTSLSSLLSGNTGILIAAAAVGVLLLSNRRSQPYDRAA